jgi:hypothetical protein
MGWGTAEQLKTDGKALSGVGLAVFWNSGTVDNSSISQHAIFYDMRFSAT